MLLRDGGACLQSAAERDGWLWTLDIDLVASVVVCTCLSEAYSLYLICRQKINMTIYTRFTLNGWFTHNTFSIATYIAFFRSTATRFATNRRFLCWMWEIRYFEWEYLLDTRQRHHSESRIRRNILYRWTRQLDVTYYLYYVKLRLNHLIVLVHVQKTRSISDRASKDTWTVSASYPPLRCIPTVAMHGVDICRLATVCNSSWDCKVAIQVSASCRLFVELFHIYLWEKRYLKITPGPTG